MPRRDKSGPEGLGALTGRGLGNCDSKKATNNGLGQMLGKRFGVKSRRLGRSYGASLEEEKDLLTKRLNQINRMLYKEK